jgi:hypothetical protein
MYRYSVSVILMLLTKILENNLHIYELYTQDDIQDITGNEQQLEKHTHTHTRARARALNMFNL